MKWLTRSLFALLLAVAFACSPSDDELETSREQTLLNVQYGEHERNRADIYLPAGRSAATTKVFILIHGGGWVEGDKSSMTDFVNLLKQDFPDHAYVNMNYRLATTGSPGFPKQTDDIAQLIAFLKRSNYNISNEYAMVGASAGAHLSLLYSYAFDPNHEVKAVCNVVGPVDFTDPAYVSGNYQLVALLVFPNLVGNYQYATNPEKFIEVSPALRADENSPPTISFYGELDPLIPPSQHTRFMERLTAQGVVHQSTLYPGVGHGDFTVTQYLDLQEKVVVFFNTHFN